ncbi:LCP family protein [Patescibacteria group bacterium]|nr:LCP family protein [Patescibacteria group bacterium]
MEVFWRMKKTIIYAGFTALVIAGVVFGVSVLFAPASSESLEAAEPRARDAVSEAIVARASLLDASPEVPFGSDDEINILTLGIDSRKEGEGQHCDAIHMVTINLADHSVKITSVPRGTYSYIPPGNYPETEYYIANACAYAGLDYGISQIEKIVGVRADYVATIGFSEALGMFRTLELPTTETLQWLRHRQTYQIGDPQRSQNQAVFMKDIALRITSDGGLSTPLLYLLYSFVDTDMDFATAKALYSLLVASDIAGHPERITYDMKPYHETVVLHYDPDNASEQVGSLVDRLKGRLSDEDLSLRTVEEIQADLEAYLRDSLTDDEAVMHVMDEQLFRQVEDDAFREEMHFRYLDRYVRILRETDADAAVAIVSDYILEKQYYGLTDWVEKGKNLLSTLVEEDTL